MDKRLAFAATSFQLHLAGILMDTWIFFLFVAIAGITPGYLKTLLNVFGHVERICVKSLLERWQGIVLPEATLFQILLVGKILPENECHFYKFLAIACGFLGKNLFETMIYVCELLTEEPEGGSAMIPLPVFIQLYEYLASLDCSGKCPCVIVEVAEELFHPGVPPASEESSTLSRVFSVPSADVEEEEQEAVADICGGYSPSESQSSEIVHDLTEPVTRRKSSVVDGGQRQMRDHEDDVASPGQRNAPANSPEHPSEQATAPDLQSLDADADTMEKDTESYSYYGGEESEMETVSYEETDVYEPIGLENILYGICECLEPIRESERSETPPPPDIFEEFVKRMKQEVDEGRLPIRFRVPGIGPPVSVNRVTIVCLWLTECARRQEGLVGPRNIRHFLCPEVEDVQPDGDKNC